MKTVISWSISHLKTLLGNQKFMITKFHTLMIDLFEIKLKNYTQKPFRAKECEKLYMTLYVNNIEYDRKHTWFIRKYNCDIHAIQKNTNASAERTHDIIFPDGRTIFITTCIIRKSIIYRVGTRYTIFNVYR